jgi:hypothetical protein
MRNSLLKSMIATVVIGLSSMVTHAADSGNLQDVFKNACVKSWMERAGDSSDKVSYQNFGEKFCGCASTKPVGSDAEIDKAAQVCLSQTLLHDSMDTLEDKEGLSKINKDKLLASCQDKMMLIYPKMSDKAKGSATTYCQCASNKLDTLVKDQDNVTDKQFADKIDSIASDCSANIEPDKAATKNAKKS